MTERSLASYTKVRGGKLDTSKEHEEDSEENAFLEDSLEPPQRNHHSPLVSFQSLVLKKKKKNKERKKKKRKIKTLAGEKKEK